MGAAYAESWGDNAQRGPGCIKANHEQLIHVAEASRKTPFTETSGDGSLQSLTCGYLVVCR